jgi:hypothetical protein
MNRASPTIAYAGLMGFIGDIGFFCKSCNQFFKLIGNPALSKKYEMQDGEESLVELVQKCPSCGEVSGYNPDEATLEDPVMRRAMGISK